jgi:hypothetical protein
MSSSDEEIEDSYSSTPLHASDSEKHKLMTVHRKKIEDILKAAKNGRIPALKDCLAKYVEDEDEFTEAEAICGVKDG